MFCDRIVDLSATQRDVKQRSSLYDERQVKELVQFRENLVVSYVWNTQCMLRLQW